MSIGDTNKSHQCGSLKSLFPLNERLIADVQVERRHRVIHRRRQRHRRRFRILSGTTPRW